MSDDVNIPIVGGADEPCESCGAAMAPDQRYCLQCGTRRGEARVDFRRHLGGAGPGVAEAAPVAAGAVAPQVAPARALTPLTIVGGIAILGVMLVLGVLIGKDNTPATTTPIASNPPKVVVQSSGSDTGSAPKTQTASNGNTSAGKKNAGNAKPAKSTDTPVPNSSPEALKKAGATTVDDDALKALDGNDTAANSKASADLPDTIATEGKPPKPDDKAPGAGGSATVIK